MKKWIVWTVDALVCTVCTNILADEDNQFHLTGITHILNTVSSFGSSGGLGEAAAWLCLRQDIYISLTSQKPLRTNLQNFDHSDTFGRNDDFAWASRMVFLLAKVLKCAFSYEVSAAHLTLLHDIEAEVETWYSTKPHTFNPIRFIPRAQERDHRFPSIWMLLPVHGELSPPFLSILRYRN